MGKISRDLDQFYTKSEVAQKCINLLKKPISEYDMVIEPSAGTGAFYNLIDHSNKVGIDIEPKCDGVIRKDFLNWYPNEFPRPKDILTIGNPPFGKQSSIAIKFIKNASTFSDTIAFILPRGFKKRSVYDKVPLNFWKVNEFDIEPNSFIFDDEEYDVPCVWMEFEKRIELREKQKKLEPKIFKFVPVTEYTQKTNNKGKKFTTGIPPKDANVIIIRCGINAGKASNDINVSTPGTFFVKVDDDKVDEFVDKVNDIKFSKDRNTGPRSISKNELIRKINALE